MISTGSVIITASLSTTDQYLGITSSAGFNITNDLPCLIINTKILTSIGYIPIDKLKEGDLVVTDDNRLVPVLNIYKTIVKGKEDTYPYIIPKNSIANNYPKEEIKLSGKHLIKYKNTWIQPMKSKKFKQDKTNNIIKYFHIELPNYETDNLIINNGTIVESYAKPSDNNLFIYNNRF
jgi:hypothetical protein